jgi:NADPH:quinone reductase-like Zn-dependent oxidoreductase
MSRTTMQVIELAGAFGVDNLRRVERPIPTPGPGQVLLRIHAASLNYRDLMMIDGAYNPAPAAPPRPLIGRRR